MGSSALLGWFADIGLADRLEVGGKGGSLGELQRAGIAVPPGFVVKTAAFERFVGAWNASRRCASAWSRWMLRISRRRQSCRGNCGARFAAAAMPADVAEEIAIAHAALTGGAEQSAVAVRSSATAEDASDASFAGMQEPICG